nr:immunoglobulin heavy chain junction region [Macaca mulatta]
CARGGIQWVGPNHYYFDFW